MTRKRERDENEDHVEAFELGAGLHKAEPELLLAAAARRGSARYPDDKDLALWFLEGFKAARKVRDEFIRERA